MNDYPKLLLFIDEVLEEGLLLDLDRANKLLDSSDFEFRKKSLDILCNDKHSYSIKDIDKFVQLSQKVKNSFTIRAKIFY